MSDGTTDPESGREPAPASGDWVRRFEAYVAGLVLLGVITFFVSSLVGGDCSDAAECDGDQDLVLVGSILAALFAVVVGLVAIGVIELVRGVWRWQRATRR